MVSSERVFVMAFACVLFGFVLAAGIFPAVSASTLPPSHDLSVSVAPSTVTPGSNLVVSVEWSGNGIAYAVPPEELEILVYRSSDGSQAGRYAIRRVGAPEGGSAVRLLHGLCGRCQILPEESVQDMTSCLEGQLLERGLHVYIRSCLTSLVQPLEYGIGAVYICGVMLVMVQSQLGLGYMRF